MTFEQMPGVAIGTPRVAASELDERELSERPTEPLPIVQRPVAARESAPEGRGTAPLMITKVQVTQRGPACEADRLMKNGWMSLQSDIHVQQTWPRGWAHNSMVKTALCADTLIRLLNLLDQIPIPSGIHAGLLSSDVTVC